MYRTVESGLWDDPKVERLSTEAKLLFVYLFTNRHSHVSGIYPMKVALSCLELGLSDRVVRAAWEMLASEGLVKVDRERSIVWVVNMLRHQGRGEKNERSAARQLETLHGSPLIADFLAKYPEVRVFLRLDRVSIGYPGSADTLSGVGSQKQEQKQDTEKDSETEKESAPPSAPRGAPPDPPQDLGDIDAAAEAWIPISGKIPQERRRGPARRQLHGWEYGVSTGQLTEWTVLYPGLDVQRVLLIIRDWNLRNPSRRKTYPDKTGGVLDHIHSWLSREQNKARGGPPGRASPASQARAGDHESHKQRAAELDEQLYGEVPS
jgi:hypothetical protein